MRAFVGVRSSATGSAGTHVYRSLLDLWLDIYLHPWGFEVGLSNNLGENTYLGMHRPPILVRSLCCRCHRTQCAPSLGIVLESWRVLLPMSADLSPILAPTSTTVPRDSGGSEQKFGRKHSFVDVPTSNAGAYAWHCRCCMTHAHRRRGSF